MKIEIIRQRRKTMVLKIVDSDKAVLKVPFSVSDKRIETFIKSKENWLAKTSAKLKNNENFSKDFDLEKMIYVNGKPVIPTKDIEIGFENMTKSAKVREIKKYYLSMFWKIEEKAEELSKKTGLTYNEIKSADSVRIWGSYNSKRQMKLNYKLIILPEELIEYVICHELCHSIHMNHKPQFWRDVEKICPDYKRLKKELSKYAFVLKKTI